MFPLAHIVLGTGVTWGSVRLLSDLPVGCEIGENQDRDSDPIDYRLVAAGSMLPDLIDKPLGIYVLRRRVGSGRIYGHTLLFGLGLVLGGSLLARRGRHGLLGLGLGVVTHILTDVVMLSPRTFFWPLGGLRFRRQRRLERWGWRMLGRYYHDPEVMWSEGLAALVILAFGAHLKRQRRLGRFLRSGRL
ncbi:MAG: metal-dependent hydrolase [Chloroflexi bacterium]|nr:metal-dependent hydrolase [Chloroflexota bacterium]